MLAPAGRSGSVRGTDDSAMKNTIAEAFAIAVGLVLLFSLIVTAWSTAENWHDAKRCQSRMTWASTHDDSTATLRSRLNWEGKVCADVLPNPRRHR
jgi:hypothetical protein